jgi:hypothetical protein
MLGQICHHPGIQFDEIAVLCRHSCHLTYELRTGEAQRRSAADPKEEKKKKWLGLGAFASSIHNKQRPIGYRNRNPQPLADSTARLMYVRVYDSRVSSHQPTPSPSLSYLLTHTHRTLPSPTLITFTSTQVLWCLQSLTRLTVSSCETTRTRVTICLPAEPSVSEEF